jgi:hypothetical protein
MFEVSTSGVNSLFEEVDNSPVIGEAMDVDNASYNQNFEISRIFGKHFLLATLG